MNISTDAKPFRSNKTCLTRGTYQFVSGYIRILFVRKLDHLVAGGIASHISALETLIKECDEESGMSVELASQAKSAGTVISHRSTKNGIKSDVVFTYDLEVPKSFKPQNTDGEVEEFFLWSVEKVMETVSGTDDFKWNVNSVLIDFFVRHGFFCPDDKHFLTVCRGLRRALEVP